MPYRNFTVWTVLFCNADDLSCRDSGGNLRTFHRADFENAGMTFSLFKAGDAFLFDAEQQRIVTGSDLH
jgi:hypothetical protein